MILRNTTNSLIHNLHEQDGTAGTGYILFYAETLKGRRLMGIRSRDFVIFRENTIGVDINPINVQFVQSRGGRAVVMKENELPFDDDFFDSVNIDNVLEHLVDLPFCSRCNGC